jgi:hypothetical protein
MGIFCFFINNGKKLKVLKMEKKKGIIVAFARKK